MSTRQERSIEYAEDEYRANTGDIFICTEPDCKYFEVVSFNEHFPEELRCQEEGCGWPLRMQTADDVASRVKHGYLGFVEQIPDSMTAEEIKARYATLLANHVSPETFYKATFQSTEAR